MTTAIAQFMRELERVWDEHRDASIGRRDLAASLARLAPDPSVWHLPARTGAAGRPDLERFCAEDFLPHVVDPTRRRATVQVIAIVGFERGRIRSQRIHWDHATLAAQLGIPPPEGYGHD